MKELTVEIIQRCLNNCIYCSSNASSHSTNILDLDDIVRIAKSAKALGVKDINISGGEPFLHPHIVKILEIFREEGLNVVIYSSGICEFEKYVSVPDDYLDFCKKIGVDKIVFNMQASWENRHQAIANKKYNTRPYLLETIKKCVERDIRTEINFVPMKINRTMLSRVCEEASYLGVERVNLLGLVMQGNALNHREELEMNEVELQLLKMAINIISNETQKGFIRVGSPLSDNSVEKCYAALGRAVVRYDGLVFPCEAFKFLDSFEYANNISYPMNIKNSSLEKIIEMAFFKDLSSYIKSTKHQTCKDCPAQQMLVKKLVKK